MPFPSPIPPLLCSLAFLIAGLPLHVTAGEWGLEPLGETVEVAAGEAPRAKRKLESRHRRFPTDGEPVLLAEKGEARALLIVPAKPTPMERSAARFLKANLDEMTGASFQIAWEGSIRFHAGEDEAGFALDRQGKRWDHLIWIGTTQQTQQAAIHADDLKPEGYRLVSRKGHLHIVGRDDAGTGMALRGTYFGVAALLENHLGVRWLWPGALGKVIPSRSTLALEAVNEQDEPALEQRIIRNMPLNNRAKVGLAALEADEAEYLEVIRAQGEWLSSQKAGGSRRLHGGHAYGGWYEKYFAEHPSWFALQPDETREQINPERARLCESNPEVARKAAEQALEQWSGKRRFASASISPNDGSRNSYCMCAGCRRLDPPNGAPVQLTFYKESKAFTASYPSLSDRVVTYYNRVAEEALARNPEIVLAAYAYDAYRDAPLAVVAHPSIVIGFVGLSYFNEAGRRKDLDRWNRWTGKCSQLFLRPNAFHAGEGLPAAYTKALTEDLRHCYRTGMIAADFDSLIGHWSTQGLNYYVLAKLLWDPTLDPAAMVEDYCQKGFGAASSQVAAYFAALEEATTEVARIDDAAAENAIRDEEQDEATTARVSRWKPFEKRYFAVFTREKTDQLRSLLTEAAKVAGGDATVQKRIAFLAAGLDYADHYRAALEHPRQKEVKEAFFNYFARLSREQPQALNTAHLLWRASIARIPRLP